MTMFQSAAITPTIITPQRYRLGALPTAALDSEMASVYAPGYNSPFFLRHWPCRNIVFLETVAEPVLHDSFIHTQAYLLSGRLLAGTSRWARVLYTPMNCMNGRGSAQTISSRSQTPLCRFLNRRSV